MINRNKLSISILLAGGLLSTATVYAQPELYGRFSLGLVNSYDQTIDERTNKVENQASRLGIKGKQVLDNNLTLIYQYETAINPSDSTKPIFSIRNSFLGIEGVYGQLITGTFDTPLKKAQGKIDLFNDTTFDMSKMLSGEVRHKQSVQYQTPKLMDSIRATLDWLPAEEADTDDGLSASVEYTRSRFGLTLALDSKVAGDGGVVTAKNAQLNTARAVISVNATNNIKLGFLVQQSEGIEADKSEETGWVASAAWKLNKTTLKAQIGQGLAGKDASGANSDAKLSQVTLGVDYAMAASTTAFVYSGVSRFEEGAGGTAVGQSRNDVSAGVGLTYKF